MPQSTSEEVRFSGTLAYKGKKSQPFDQKLDIRKPHGSQKKSLDVCSVIKPVQLTGCPSPKASANKKPDGLVCKP